MDYVRDQLVSTYGTRVACYSGRGGERFDPALGRWMPVSKKEVKALFREGQEVKVLVGTDSLSEGLNLQTCGKLVNYDMPWNLMRVEQRIGRVDRIGGRPLVEVSNYLYEGTVEERVYRGIAEDFDWFEDVVGPAQPVLSQVERAIEEVALEAPSAARERRTGELVGQIRAQIEQAKARAITLGDLDSSPDPRTGDFDEPAIDLAGLEQVLTQARPTADRLRPHPEINGAWLLSRTVGRGEEVAVTFRRGVLGEHAPDVRLLSYLTPELAELLGAAGVAEVAAEDGGDPAHESIEVRSLRALEARLEPAHPFRVD